VSARRWIALWAGFLAALAVLALLLGTGTVPPLLLGGAALGTLALALVGAPGRSPATASRSSLPAVVMAVAIACIVTGSEVGFWLLALGAGLLVLSAGMLVAERRPG
jgi:hypothetical protein